MALALALMNAVARSHSSKSYKRGSEYYISGALPTREAATVPLYYAHMCNCINH
jgi:hypothetical protein